MKKVTLLIASILVLSSCNKLTQFNMDYKTTVVIPSSTGINLPFNVFTPDIESNAEATFEVNDTRKDLIEEIKLTKMNLNITSPSSGDFGFLRSIELFLSADGLDEIRVAWKENIPANADNTLVLETTNADLKEYIKKDNFSLRVNTVTDEIIASDHQIEVDSRFFVDAKLFR